MQPAPVTFLSSWLPHTQNEVRPEKIILRSAYPLADGRCLFRPIRLTMLLPVRRPTIDAEIVNVGRGDASRGRGSSDDGDPRSRSARYCGERDLVRGPRDLTS